MNRTLNRRRDARVPVHVPVHLSTIDPGVQSDGGRRLFHLSNGVCLNLSRGGAFIRTPGSLQRGTRVLLEIQLPGSASVEAVGTIVWGKSSAASGTGGVRNLGVQFLGGAKGQLSLLDDFLTDGPVSHSAKVACMR
ncbi:MAG: PilZ domain-containing protein [Pseudomonadota bacterium]